MEPEPIGLETRDKREYRRLCAWNMYQRGFWQKDIAEALGVTEGAVSQWISKAKREGVEALRSKPHNRKPSRLSEAQRDRLVRMLAKGAEAYGFRGGVWTQARIADVIRRTFGVTYHPSHISKLLRACGWSQQTPRKRASQRDEDAIKRWAEETWLALKKSA